MIDVAAANKLIMDVPEIYGAKRSTLVLKEIVCSEGDFVAGRLEDGRYLALWTNHARAADTEEEFFKDVLNKHEITLFTYGIKK